MKLLTSNHKLEKSIERGWLTAGLSLAPHKLGGGKTVCPWASPGCVAACLNTSGMGLMPGVQDARVKRTELWRRFPEAFRYQLSQELEAFEKKAEKQGLKPAVRLNVYSDLDWRDTVKAFPRIQFYDYTKNAGRMFNASRPSWPSNYHLTYSRSEKNDETTVECLRQGWQVAIVVDAPTFTQRRVKARDHWLSRDPLGLSGLRYSDGDRHDLTWQHGQVVVLKPKGKALHDKTGFVIR